MDRKTVKTGFPTPEGARFQESLTETVALLEELQAQPGMNRTTKRAIARAVANLNDARHSLPDVVASPDSFQPVFGAIEEAFNVWLRVFARSG